MSTAIAIFVKTPALSPVKTRLADGIGSEAAKQFYRLSLKAVQQTVKGMNLNPHWAVAEEKGLNDPLWQDFPALYTGEGGLGERQHNIYETLLKKHDRVLLIGADAPQISPSIIKESIIALNHHDFVIGPARDGGYYLFGGKISTEQKIWTSVPWSTSVTRDRLEAALPLKPVHLPLLTDVDTQPDLQYIHQEMPQNMSSEQTLILKWIEKS